MFVPGKAQYDYPHLPVLVLSGENSDRLLAPQVLLYTPRKYSKR
jgi:hypothetical protein